MPPAALIKEGFSQEEIDAQITIFGPVGCKFCDFGYKGRTGIFQVMPVTDAIARVILEGGNAVQIAKTAEAEGIWDLRRSGLEEIKDGHTSLEEINRVTIS